MCGRGRQVEPNGPLLSLAYITGRGWVVCVCGGGEGCVWGCVGGLAGLGEASWRPGRRLTYCLHSGAGGRLSLPGNIHGICRLFFSVIYWNYFSPRRKPSLCERWSLAGRMITPCRCNWEVFGLVSARWQVEAFPGIKAGACSCVCPSLDL